MLLAPGFAGAHWEENDWVFHHMGWGMGGGGWLGGLMMLVWLGVGVLAFIWLWRKLFK